MVGRRRGTGVIAVLVKTVGSNCGLDIGDDGRGNFGKLRWREAFQTWNNTGPIHKKRKCNKKCKENCNEMDFDSETCPNYSISPFHYIIFGPCESGMDS